MTREIVEYETIAFFSGEEAKEPLKIWEEYGAKAAARYMLDWDGCGGDMRPAADGPPWGKTDTVERAGPTLVVSCHELLGYISLTREHYEG